MKTSITRRSLLRGGRYGEPIIYEGAGDLAPVILQMDDSRLYPGHAFQAKIYKPGNDEDGDQNRDTYYIYGAKSHFWGSWVVVEGYVIGDGTNHAKMTVDPPQFHIERWDFTIND